MSIDLSGKNESQSDASNLNIQTEDIPVIEAEQIYDSEEELFVSEIPRAPKKDKDFTKKEHIAIQTEKINLQQKDLNNRKKKLEIKKEEIDKLIKLSKIHNSNLAEKRQRLKIKIIKIKKCELELQVKQLKLDLKNAKIDIKVDKRIAKIDKTLAKNQ